MFYRVMFKLMLYSHSQWNFYLSSVKGPELINMYVGQSEENIRESKTVLCLTIYSKTLDSNLT